MRKGGNLCLAWYYSGCRLFQHEHGDEESQAAVQKLIPNKIKQRRKVKAQDGVSRPPPRYICFEIICYNICLYIVYVIGFTIWITYIYYTGMPFFRRTVEIRFSFAPKY